MPKADIGGGAMDRIKLTISMACRNLLRSRRRTVSTLLAIAVGLVGLAFLDGYMTYAMRGLRESVIHNGTGHIQAALSGAYFDEGDGDPMPFMLPDAKGLEAELRALPEAKDVVPTLSFVAVLSSKGRTSTVQVSAMPTAQAKANLERRLIASGKDLEPGEEGRILVGRGLARKLGLAPGDSVSLFAISKGGGVSTQSYEVKGTTSTIIAAIDNVSVSMDLRDASELLGVDAVPQLTVFLKSTADTDRVTERLRAASAGSLRPGDKLSAASGITFRSWEELSAYYRQAIGTFDMVFAVTRLIVLIVALFSISGTLSLAILERLREIGTLRAFGARRAQVVAMFLAEGLALGLAGIAAGSLLGLGGIGLVNAAGGIAMPPQPGTSSAFTILFTPEPETLLASGLWILAASALGALVPGGLSSRRVIAELLRSK
jgi:putative ABC transport system permease protein